MKHTEEQDPLLVSSSPRPIMADAPESRRSADPWNPSDPLDLTLSMAPDLAEPRRAWRRLEKLLRDKPMLELPRADFDESLLMALLELHERIDRIRTGPR